jgi:hypothetical protein
MAMLLFTAFVLAVAVQHPGDVDSDHDGLSDFDEIHKYFTDPHNPDTDGDGIPDGDWNERREYTYSVRAILHVLPPVNLAELNDDYQDARVLEVRDDCIEIEVVCYPLNTNESAIEEDRDWRAHAGAMKEWLAPGPTSNWDDALQAEIRAEIAQDGIDVARLSDRALAEQASKWLMKRSRGEDSFTTFAVEFADGRPRIVKGMEDTVARELAKTGRTLDEQWNRELFGKGMFETRVHGTCTSSAIYLSTCLRALGLPTRSIVCVPVIDASDPREIELVQKRITHNRIRRTILRAAARAGNSWNSHTFNEVFVGGRWQRLNYDRLGQNILDQNYLGLMVHVNTFRDHAESGLLSWGLRTTRDQKADVFGGSNPYACVSLSDLFGAHAHIENPPLPSDPHVLTIRRAYWFEDPHKPDAVDAKKLEDPRDGGHLLVHVDEGNAGEGIEQYADFYAHVSKDFVLRAPGQADVRAIAKRGYWVDAKTELREFYIHIAPADFAAMAHGVAYALVPRDTSHEYAWKVAAGVAITRP